MSRVQWRTMLCLSALLPALALAHETQLAGEGEGEYKVIAGYSSEPPYTDERNGLDLFVRSMADEPVENLENSLSAELIAPDGRSTLALDLRAVHGEPGAYTDDFVLSLPGIYRLHVSGFIGGTAVDLSYDLHEVKPLSELRFP